ncbi:MAG: nucleotidyl transferase AbiEii/AbiGii toxin family protein [Spirochaetes bacterium]|nr:nucleotidyl transferase AbiEii/AbiGii toxin family protein [Spirochaetota bacterium]
MISGVKEFFLKEHFESNKGTAPAYLCELVVYCLELVSQLSSYGLKYRFKGGNSLLILLEDPYRFSIDVDIVCTVSKEELSRLIKKIVSECELFHSFEVRPHKTKPWLPMISFKLFFSSFYQKQEDAFVMLDAVLEEPPYKGVLKQVKCGKIYNSGQEVEVPGISGLIADKLLTIGPKTLGIPIGKKKEAQRLKHIFDVALLVNHEYDLNEFKEALNRIIQQENELQKSGFQLDEIIRDTKLFCGLPLKYEKLPDLSTIRDNDYLFEIVKGFDEFRKYIFKIDYTWERFRNDCSVILQLLDSI